MEQELEKYVKFEVALFDLDVGNCFYSCFERGAKWQLFKEKVHERQEYSLFESDFVDKTEMMVF